MTSTVPAHVPRRRILERVVTLPGVQPLRIFPLLLPMWQVEIKATIREAQPYEVFDRYLSRAIASSGLRDATALSDFFGVRPALVERGLRFLTTIGHLQRNGDTLTLTELGRSSVADECRYVVKEDRQVLYFDGFTGAPVPRTHYSGAVWLDEPRLSLTDGTRFHVLAGSASWRIDALTELLRRADRDQFNVPAALTAAEPVQVRSVWLPAYVVECVASLLVFVKAVDGADPYLSKLVSPYLRDVLAAEERSDTARVWREWLDGAGFTDVRPQRLANGVLRASLPATVFGTRFGWPRLGSFEVRERTFLQLWCEDDAVRRRAVLERVGAIVRAGAVRNEQELIERLAEMAAQLHVDSPAPDDLKAYARSRDDSVLIATLSAF